VVGETITVYLARDNRHGSLYLVFTWEDPRNSGYEGHVEEGVFLDYDMESVHSWPDGTAQPEACLGQSPDNPNHYKVFKYQSDLEASGYTPVSGSVVVFGSWGDYAALHLIPPDPRQTTDEKWYGYLDKLDEDSRVRRQLTPTVSIPLVRNRDNIAAWVARRHLIADSSIREVWYLPKGSPQDEIRFLELNDRLAGAELSVEPIDFALDIEGAAFRLFVADITTEQLANVKRDSSLLPRGWSLDENTIWRRGA
jgi:hypothetical protein